MKRETYDYYYTRNGSDLKATSSFATSKVEWLSGALVSLGVAKSFGKRMDAFLAPNYLMPLQGVGQGRVKLNGLSVRLGMSFKVLGK
ncbi:MAG: hypothetical protein EAY75_06015 [Bacteroidetes bacterium]|nr:MAG: hypothetical protein EAY75_06015 [Bacteroidota bacterium]